MKRFCALLAAVMIAVHLSPCAHAAVTLSKPTDGQMIYRSADDYESYKAEFYLSALSSLRRSGDDLVLNFANAKLTLRGFFATRDGQRTLTFAGAASVSAADFDGSGNYTGLYYDGYLCRKDGASPKELSFDTGDDTVRLVFTTGSSGSALAAADGQGVFGQQRTDAMELIDACLARGGGDRSINSFLELILSVSANGSMTLVKETLTGLNGLTAVCTRPQVVYLPDTGTLLPVAKGRATVVFSNAYGDELQRLSVRVTDDDAILSVSCQCPSCAGEQGGALHFLPCGHYSCSAGFDASEHAVPECGIAGHCVTDGGAHSLCTNCRQPLCDGGEHGWGVCRHEHSWTQKSYVSPTADAPGESVAVCSVCGAEYTQVLPALGVTS